MTRTEAETVLTPYIQSIYGFALKHCRVPQDAQDLSQEILLCIFRALLSRDDIVSVPSFIWTAAHHALCNYYRNQSARMTIGIPIDALFDHPAGADEDPAAIMEIQETEQHLYREIAYLSATQRRIIVLYYYENMRQAEIATILGIPVGTVKWHLFEAKRELKKGMETMKNLDTLKFQPIHFAACGFSGSLGTKGNLHDFFRSPLVQNIVYTVKDRDLTAREIAGYLGVSPIYVEGEADYLAKYGFLIKIGEKYRINILLDEPDSAVIQAKEMMYENAARAFAPALFDALCASGLCEDDTIVCCSRIKALREENGRKVPIYENDRNFLMWALIPYITAISGEHLFRETISWKEAVTIRPDGGENICTASVETDAVRKMKHRTHFMEWNGPCWNENDRFLLWSIDSPWSGMRKDNARYGEEASRALSLFCRFFGEDEPAETLFSTEERAWLAEHGYMRTCGKADCEFWESMQIVWIRSKEAKQKLLAIGGAIKEQLWTQLEAWKAPFVRAMLDQTPKHLHKMRMYGLQYLFFSDGWFLLYCIEVLLETGKLQPPTEEQKKSLSTLLIEK